MGKRKVSLDQEKIICQRYIQGEYIADIAEDFPVTRGGIRRKLIRNNIEIRPYSSAERYAAQKHLKVLSEEQEEIACQMYLEGYSYSQIHEHLGVGSKTTIQNLVERRGRKRPRKKSRIFNHQQIKEIIELYEFGWSCYKVAEKFNTSGTNIHKLLVNSGVKTRSSKEAAGTMDSESIRQTIDRYQDGASPKEIAEELGYSESHVKVVLKRSEIKTRDRSEAAGGIAQENISGMIEKYESGKSATILASEYNVNAGTIGKILRRNGVKIRSLFESFSGINESEYDAIAASYESGESAKSLGKRYNVEGVTILGILQRIGIKKRTYHESIRAVEPKDYEEIIARYEKGESSVFIGNDFDVAHSPITKLLRDHGIEIRKASGDSVQDAIDGTSRFQVPRETAFYIYELEGYPQFRKLGIAFDLKIRRKRSGGIYSDEVLVQWFSTREEAFFFEQAMLKETRHDWNYPDTLMNSGWNGITEIRTTKANTLLEIAEFYMQQIEDLGIWEFASSYCEMTTTQRNLCQSKAIESKKGKSTLPTLKVGDYVAGCTFLDQFKGGMRGGETRWKLRCNNCGTEFERRASEQWYMHNRGHKKLCHSICSRSVSDQEYKKRLSIFNRLEVLESYKGRRIKIIHRCLKHGLIKKIAPDSALQGCGLKECCGVEALSIANTKDIEYFINRATKKYGDYYDYSKSIYVDQHTPLTITCPKHGDFQQTPSIHTSPRAKGCPKCTWERFSDEYRIDYTGIRYGKLTFVRPYVSDDPSKKLHWIMRCGCGREYPTSPGNIRKENGSKMCPTCSIRQNRRRLEGDIIGKSINRFTILAEWGTNKHGNSRILCRCICGNPSIQIRHQVLSGYIQGCGCLKSGDSVYEFKSDNNRSNSDCYFYVATIDHTYFKPGIASNLNYRKRAGENRYTSFEFVSPKLCRSEAWAIEQSILVKTMDARIRSSQIDYEGWGGSTELRNPEMYSLDWYRHTFYELLDELYDVGWLDLYEKYCKA